MAAAKLKRRLVGALFLGLAETAVVLALTTATIGPAATQVIDDRFPFIEERARRGGPDRGGLFGNDSRQYSPSVESNAKAPPSTRKPDTASPALTTVVVLGDSMSDWLAYGLEQAAADSPDIGIIRRSRTSSGLVRLDVKNDPRGEFPDWPVAVRDMLNADKPNFIVMMIGLNDRRPIREKAEKPEKTSAKTSSSPSSSGPAAAPGAAPQATPGEAADKDREKDADDADEPTIMTEPRRATPGMVTYEFRSDKWVELYTKRIDDMMAALKAKNVPVFWVGLPPIRSPKAAEDISFLNDLYRSRAEKAGITYIDTWDGFVDDAGRFVMQGPDFEGQIRRLRSNDGVHFTQSGARKLAHYVEREIQRSLMTHATPVALPVPDEPAPQTAPTRPGTAAIARPLAGPVMPLTSTAEADELLGGARGTRDGVVDPIATKVLVRGDQASAPAGRADDFVWPRRGVAALGTDPLVATTTTPMTPMINPQDQRQVAAAPAAAPGAPGQALHRPPTAAPVRQAGQAAPSQGLFGAPRPPTAIAQQQAQRQQDQRRFFQPSQPSFFFPFFGR